MITTPSSHFSNPALIYITLASPPKSIQSTAAPSSTVLHCGPDQSSLYLLFATHLFISVSTLTLPLVVHPQNSS